MKRLWIVLFTLLLSFSLFGCAKQEPTYTASINGVDFLIDREQQTISGGEDTYHYEFSGDSSTFSVRITYPDGASYWYNQTDGSGSGGWSDDYDGSKYVSGDTLVNILQMGAPERVNAGKFVAAFVLIALGIFNILAPKASWYLGHGWQYKNAEPSDAALLFSRVSGAFIILIGIILMLS